jgi:hypothetical protein
VWSTLIGGQSRVMTSGISPPCLIAATKRAGRSTDRMIAVPGTLSPGVVVAAFTSAGSTEWARGLFVNVISNSITVTSKFSLVGPSESLVAPTHSVVVPWVVYASRCDVPVPFGQWTSAAWARASLLAGGAYRQPLRIQSATLLGLPVKLGS